MKTVLWVVLGVLSGAMAHGSDALEGQLSVPHFMSDGYVLVATDGLRSSGNPCSSGYQNRFAVNAMTEQGKIQLAGLLSAHAAGRRVRIVGSGGCSPHGEEIISYFYISD